MTLDEFLDDYVPNVLRPLPGTWSGSERGCIRIEWASGIASCPLTAERRLTPGRFLEEGKRIGLGSIDIHAILGAADTIEPGYLATRARLRAGLGLV
jgi:hypothetical protein